jgi:endonuclease G, mitochondrial
MLFLLPALRRSGSGALLLAVAAWASSCSTSADPTPVAPAPPVTPPAVLPEHLTLGNPSGAVASVNQPTNYLLLKPQYALSYHRDRGTPNWVSWHLTLDNRGSADRQDDFRADNTLPAGWYQVQGTSYSGSGFDRGHNCPSADRTNSVADNSATFLMTNMIPQAPRNNQQTWANLENFTRAQLSNGLNEVYVIMGSYGTGGTGSGGYKTTLDNGRVTVPNRVWKVVVILPVGDNDASRVSAATRVIAVDTPNDQSINANWGQYRTTVDAIEAATGYDLLSAVPTAVQQTVESRTDAGAL